MSQTSQLVSKERLLAAEIEKFFSSIGIYQMRLNFFFGVSWFNKGEPVVKIKIGPTSPFLLSHVMTI